MRDAKIRAPRRKSAWATRCACEVSELGRNVNRRRVSRPFARGSSARPPMPRRKGPACPHPAIRGQAGRGAVPRVQPPSEVTSAETPETQIAAPQTIAGASHHPGGSSMSGQSGRLLKRAEPGLGMSRERNVPDRSGCSMGHILSAVSTSGPGRGFNPVNPALAEASLARRLLAGIRLPSRIPPGA